MEALKGNLRNLMVQLLVTYGFLTYNIFGFKEKLLKEQFDNTKYALISAILIFIGSIVFSYFTFPLSIEIEQKNKLDKGNTTKIVVNLNEDVVMTSSNERWVNVVIKIKKNKSFFNMIYLVLIKWLDLNIYIFADGFTLTPDKGIYIDDCTNHGVKINLHRYLNQNLSENKEYNIPPLEFYYQVNRREDLGDIVPVSVRVGFCEDLIPFRKNIKNKVIRFLLKLHKIEEHTIKYIKDR